MRFRMGLVIGFGAGYYLGTAAGRERHEQLQDVIRKVKRTETFEEASEKARAIVDLSVERAKDLTGSNGGPSTPMGGQFSASEPGGSVG